MIDMKGEIADSNNANDKENLKYSYLDTFHWDSNLNKKSLMQATQQLEICFETVELMLSQCWPIRNYYMTLRTLHFLNRRVPVNVDKHSITYANFAQLLLC